MFSYPPPPRIRSRWPQGTNGHLDWTPTSGPINVPARLGFTPSENRDRVTGARDRGGDTNPPTLATLQGTTLDPPGSIGATPPPGSGPGVLPPSTKDCGCG